MTSRLVVPKEAPDRLRCCARARSPVRRLHRYAREMR